MNETEKKAFMKMVNAICRNMRGNLLMVMEESKDESFHGAITFIENIEKQTKALKKLMKRKITDTGASDICKIEGHQFEDNPHSKYYGKCHRCGQKRGH